MVSKIANLPNVESKIDGDGNERELKNRTNEKLLAIIYDVDEHILVFSFDGCFGFDWFFRMVVKNELFNRIIVFTFSGICAIDLSKDLNRFVTPSSRKQKLRTFG